MSFIRKIKRQASNLYYAVRYMADQGRRAKIDYNELGAVGTQICGSYLDEEYLSQFSTLDMAVETADEMRKSDPSVNASLLSYELPIKSINPDFKIDQNLCERYNVSEEKQQEMIDFCKQALLENMRRPWNEIIGEILTFIETGVQVMEILWENKDGKVMVKDLAFRHPRTYLWDFDNTDNLVAVEQANYYSNKAAQPMPVEKCLIFVNQKKGNNYNGVSFCRYMYRPWFQKKILNKLMMIGFERFLVPTPYLTPKEGLRVGNYTAAKNFVESIRSHEKAGGVLPEGWIASILGDNFAGSQTAILKERELTKEIFFAVLTQNQLTGMTGTGSFKLSEDKTEFFMMALTAIIQIIKDVFNYQLLPRLIDANFDTSVYPYMDLVIDRENAVSFFQSLALMAEKGIIMRDDEIENLARQKLGLPVKKEEEELPEEPEPGDDEPEKAEQLIKTSEDKRYWRDLTEFEEKAGGIETLQNKERILNFHEEEFKKKAKTILEKQRKEFLKKIKGKKIPEVYKIEVPYMDEFRELVLEQGYKTALAGMKEVFKQMKQDMPAEAEQRMAKYLEDRSWAVAHKQADDFRNFCVFVLTSKQEGDAFKQIEATAELSVNDSFKRFLRIFLPNQKE